MKAGISLIPGQGGRLFIKLLSWVCRPPPRPSDRGGRDKFLQLSGLLEAVLTPVTGDSHGASLEHSETLRMEIFLSILLTVRLPIYDLRPPPSATCRTMQSAILPSPVWTHTHTHTHTHPAESHVLSIHTTWQKIRESGTHDSVVSKTDVQRTRELHDITFPSISIPLLPVSLRRKWLHASQTTLDSQGRLQLSRQPCRHPSSNGSQSTGGTEERPTSSLWVMPDGKHPYVFLEGPSTPHPSPFHPRSGENPVPQESKGFLHALFVILFSLFALLEQKHLKIATSAFERSQMRKRWSDPWNVIW